MLHMSTSRRRFLGNTGLALTGGFLLTMPGSRARATTQQLNFMTPWGMLVAYAPVLVAHAAGHFEAEGLEVNIIPGGGSAQAVQQILAGQVLLSRTGGIDLLKAVGNEGAPLKSVATLCHESTFYVISSTEAPVSNPVDMAGKTVGIVSQGGGTENYLDILLAGAGVPRDDVRREVTGNSPGAFNLIEMGRVDAFIADVGVVINLRRSGAELQAWNVNDFAPIPAQCYIASDTTIDAGHEAITPFLRAVHSAIADINADESLDDIMALLARYELEELNAMEVAKEVLRAEAAFWMAEGPDNVLRNVPENWARGWELAMSADLAQPGDPETIFTNAFADQV